MKALTFLILASLATACMPDAYSEGEAAAQARCDCLAQYAQPTPKAKDECRKNNAELFREKAAPFKDNKDALSDFTEGYVRKFNECGGGDQMPAN